MDDFPIVHLNFLFFAVLQHQLLNTYRLNYFRNAAQAGRKDETVRRHGEAVNLLQLILGNHDRLV